jgi:hypothetical protein
MLSQYTKKIHKFTPKEEIKSEPTDRFSFNQIFTKN